MSIGTVAILIIVGVVVAVILYQFLSSSDGFAEARKSASEMFWNSSYTPDRPESDEDDSEDESDTDSEDNKDDASSTGQPMGDNNIQIRRGNLEKEVLEGSNLVFQVGSSNTLSVWGYGDAAYSCSITVLDDETGNTIGTDSGMSWEVRYSPCAEESMVLDDFLERDNVLSKVFNPTNQDVGSYKLQVSLRDSDDERLQFTYIKIIVVSRDRA